MEDLDKIPQSFNETIVDSNLTGLAKDGVEFGIDSLMTDGLLKDIPIISTLIGLIKTTQNVSNWIFLRKIVSFLKGINNVDPDKRKEMIALIDNSGQYRNKVGEQLLFIIDHCEDDIKAETIAKLFRAFLIEVVSYTEFLKGSSIINRLTICDFNRFINQKVIMIEDSDFIGVGLAFSYTTPIVVENEIEGDWDDRQKFNSYGGETEIELTSIGETLRKVFKTEKNNE